MKFAGKREQATLTESQGAGLLGLARAAIAYAVGLAPLPEIPADTPNTSVPVFVTLRSHGELRGCMGTLKACTPVSQAVQDCALAAAFRDSRFDPVTVDEVGHLQLEISILGSFREIEGPADIRIGTDGLLIERGSSRGILLPKVATEFQVDADQFLSMVCRKAGLPDDAWQNAMVRAFTVEAFSESQHP